MTKNIQFKYGEVWQYIYQLKDSIKWGGRVDVGNPTYSKVKVYGITSPSICSNCKENTPEEYDIYITNSIIESTSELQKLQDYSIDIDYCVLK
ncbi:MAG: hypothetical protein EOP45_09205 [Sphingobacteriaceae bacterium]|nr:MAG: hypothetical protein EOP45_09205 [Sphingobacteriaceae bacterium]